MKYARVEPEHLIITKPWEYEVVSVSYHFAAGRSRKSHIDLVLCKEGIGRCLRFGDPQQVHISDALSEGIEILDIRVRQWEGMQVLVRNHVASDEGVHFYARDVVEVYEAD